MFRRDSALGDVLPPERSESSGVIDVRIDPIDAMIVSDWVVSDSQILQLGGKCIGGATHRSNTERKNDAKCPKPLPVA